MAERFILAVDQGTTNTKVILIDSHGNRVSEASEPAGITFPRPGWVEQDPIDIWHSVTTAIEQCLTLANNPAVAAVAVSNQRESAVAWDRITGMPIGPLVSWQCRRSAPLCEQLRNEGYSQPVLDRTGLALDPMFTASKIRWLLDNAENGHKRTTNGEICVGTVDSWLLWNMTGGKAHQCDMTNASRTQLFNIHTLDWDPELLDAFGIPRAALPDVHYSSYLFGETVQIGSLPAGTPIGSMIGDSHGAMYGHGEHRPGTVKATYGTGSSLMTPLSEIVISQHGLSTTIGWADTVPVHALEGNIYVTGAAVQWLRDFLGLDDTADVAALAETVNSPDGLYFVPAFVGLGAPHWDDNARGLITGLTRGSSRAHMARAVIESIAYQIRDVFDVMATESPSGLSVLLADGGASRNDNLMQFQADILGYPVLRNRSTVLSALGAAFLAGLTVGIWASRDEIAALPRQTDRFEPHINASAREALYEGWKQAVYRTTIKP